MLSGIIFLSMLALLNVGFCARSAQLGDRVPQAAGPSRIEAGPAENSIARLSQNSPAANRIPATGAQDMTKRMQHCFWCGEELSIYDTYQGDIEHCGKRDCAKEAQHEIRARYEDRAERAADDGYDRY